MKQYVRTIHLWTGLIFGTLLVLQGLTGSILSWRHELDRFLNPGLLRVAPPSGLRDGDPLTVAPASVRQLTENLARDPRYGRPSMLMFPERAGGVFIAWYRPAPGGSAWRQGVTRQVMVDPATLAVLGERNWGEAGVSRPLLMPTLFHLHRYLMAGDGGKVVVAVEGVALFLAALTGLVAWWPRLTRSAWVAALTVRHGGSWPRFSFQLHRAAGFFVAPLFLFSAFSGVEFNMPEWVTPAIKAVAPISAGGKVVNKSDASLARIAPDEALAAAQAHLPQGRISRLTFPAKPNQPYEIRMRQPEELREGDGATRLSIDSGSGEVLRVVDPLRSKGGDRFMNALYPLHTGEAAGIAGRVFVSFYGLMPLAFFATGLVVWIKFRRKPKKPTRLLKQTNAISAEAET